MVGSGRVHAAGAAGRALCPHRASRSVDSVRDSGRDAGGRVRRRDRNPDQARRPSGTAGFDRAVRHRHARRAGAGADLCAGKRLAHDRAGADVVPAPPGFRCSGRFRSCARWRRSSPASWCCGSATSRASSATRSAPRRSSTGCCGAMAFRRYRSGPEATSCAAAATMRRCGRWNRPRSCSRCCWRSWKSAMPSTMAMSTATAPASPRSRCRSASALAMAIGLERLRIRTGSIVHNVGAIVLTLFAGPAAVFGLMMLENADPVADRCRRRLHQSAAARLCPARGAGAAVVLCGGGPASGSLRQHDRRGRAGSGARPM